MKRIGLLFGLMILSAWVHGKSFVVEDIQLEGLQRVSSSPVFAALPVQTGDEVDSEDVREIIQAMLRTGFFNDVYVARDGNVLIVVLEERPAIKSLELDGNKLLKSEQLLEVLEENGLSEGEIFQKHTLEGISRSIESQYISQARYDASVKSEVTTLPNNLVSIKIIIDEGSPAAIRHYNIVGNKVFDNDALRKVFELGAKKWYLPFSKAHKYAKERLTGDIEKLESYYLDRGYLDFKVLSTQVSISPDKKSVYITINVEEGEVYTVSKVDLAGDPVLDENRVRRMILLREEGTFSQIAMTRTSEYITTLLGNSGYTNANVEGITEKNQDTHTVEVTFFIDPGKRTYVRRINFSGNTKTKDEVLRREMRQMEGASASSSKIEQSKVRLDRLGYFKEVNVETVDVPGTSDLVDVNFKVEEQPSGSISASLGYADYSGVNLGFSISEANWLGGGNNLSVAVNRNKYQENYRFSYTDPYFTPDGVTRGISLYHRLTDYEKLNGNVGRYAIDSTGMDVTFGYPVSEVSFLRFGVGYNYQAISTGTFAAQQILSSPYLLPNTSLTYISQSDYLKYLDSLSNSDGQEFQFDTFRVDESNLVLSPELGFIDQYGSEFHSGLVNLSWNRKTLNRGILATRGNSQSVSFEASVPGSDLEYYKVTFDAQMFKPLTKDLTLRFSTKLGYGNGYGSMDELPFIENYRAGGFGSVRGFERYTLGPKIVPNEFYLRGSTGWEDINENGIVDTGESSPQAYVMCDDPSNPHVNPQTGRRPFLGCEPGKLAYVGSNLSNSSASSYGGNILVEFSTELILPIPFIEDSRTMQLVAFIDAGNVFSSNCFENQLSCHDVGLSELSSSFGLGFKWLSAMGPLTFSLAEPINENELDQTKVFDFSFGTGF